MLIAVMAAFSFAICSAEETPKMQDENDEINYSLGYQIGGDLKRQKVEIRSDLIIRGIKDAMTGAKPLLSSKEMRNILVDLKRRVTEADRKKLMEARSRNLAEGEAFLSENAKKEGVHVLPSGLQYRVIREGSGATPKSTDTVTVNYRGTLVDGTEFDSSYKRNKPARFRVDRVIRGWTEALQMMKEGAEWELFIPAELAYGQQGAGKAIPPNSVLIFRVELLSDRTDGKD